MIIANTRLPIRLLSGTIFDVETTTLNPPGELITIGYVSGDELWVFQREPHETEIKPDPFKEFLPPIYVDKCPKIVRALYPRSRASPTEVLERMGLQRIKTDKKMMEREGKEIENKNQTYGLLERPCLIKFLVKLPRPFIAYNKQFEEKWLGFKFDRDAMETWKRCREAVRRSSGYKLSDLVPEKPLVYLAAAVFARWLYGTMLSVENTLSEKEIPDRLRQELALYRKTCKELWKRVARLSTGSDELIHSKEIPSLWNEAKRMWEAGLDYHMPLYAIIIHNISDLLRTLFLCIWEDAIKTLETCYTSPARWRWKSSSSRLLFSALLSKLSKWKEGLKEEKKRY
mgnify:CR=1 FL=1